MSTESNDVRRYKVRQQAVRETVGLLIDCLTKAQRTKLQLLVKAFDFASTGTVLVTTSEVGDALDIFSHKARRDLELLFKRCGGKFEMERVYLDYSGKERPIDVSELFGDKGGRGNSPVYKLTCTRVKKVYESQHK